MSRSPWAEFGAGVDSPTLAIDTEFQGVETLTVQCAARVGEEIRLQLYHSPDIPAPGRGWFGAEFTRRFDPLPARVTVLPAKVLSPDLSPARVLTNLYMLPPAQYWSRVRGEAHLTRSTEGRVAPPGVTVQVVGHFLRADFVRGFGRTFWQKLLVPSGNRPAGVSIRETRVIGLTGVGAEQFKPPVVEYVRSAGTLVPVRLTTSDTAVAFGPGPLDDLVAAFLGLGKSRELDAADKAHMKRAFVHDPKRAYHYAATDAVLTLLLAERMAALHTEVYHGLGFDPTEAPRCHATPDLRLSNLLLRDVARRAGEATSQNAPALRNVELPSLERAGSVPRPGPVELLPVDPARDERVRRPPGGARTG